jgi:hypothetical protein
MQRSLSLAPVVVGAGRCHHHEIVLSVGRRRPIFSGPPRGTAARPPTNPLFFSPCTSHGELGFVPPVLDRQAGGGHGDRRVGRPRGEPQVGRVPRHRVRGQEARAGQDARRPVAQPQSLSARAGGAPLPVREAAPAPADPAGPGPARHGQPRRRPPREQPPPPAAAAAATAATAARGFFVLLGGQGDGGPDHRDGALRAARGVAVGHSRCSPPDAGPGGVGPRVGGEGAALFALERRAGARERVPRLAVRDESRGREAVELLARHPRRGRRGGRGGVDAL